jgi:hypothetical protein
MSSACFPVFGREHRESALLEYAAQQVADVLVIFREQNCIREAIKRHEKHHWQAGRAGGTL